MYQDFIGKNLFPYLVQQSTPTTVEGVTHIGETGGLETKEALEFLVELYQQVRSPLFEVLRNRELDREFIDSRTKCLTEFNYKEHLDYLTPDYQTVIGLEDDRGRIVIGPLQKDYLTANPNKVAPLPQYLQGNHVTLFGPPDSEKMCINAMNTYHRKLPGEPAIIEELLSKVDFNPKWGADDEDSKTPMRDDLIQTGINLTACLDHKIEFTDPKSKKEYKLAKEKLSQPIKRFPGLALPSLFMFYNGESIPLHLYDFALHFYHNYKNEEALCFYIPKLENEEEARYIKFMLETAETLIHQMDSSYKLGSIRLMIVLENPRAVFRTNEIMDELYPYFAGASLGWHDFLGSTARLFKECPDYKIPVKADPNIVIKYIKASHELLARVVGPRGGIKVGGMYGILPTNTDIRSTSFQLTLRGYFKDVITQFRRDLTGFWVAHPDFVRIGMAMVSAWNIFKAGDESKMIDLIQSLLEKKYANEVIQFFRGEDITSLELDDPMYERSLIVANIKESDFIPNNHPDEIRYNIFQTLQYLTDWLCGNGCVALPAQVEGVPVRVMDDLATAERSRWEVWHEIYHGRFSKEEFLRIAHEEMNFIRRDLSDESKQVAIPYNEYTEKWYPVAFKLMLKLMTDKEPAEFATELLLPFTLEEVREKEDPLVYLKQLDPQKYSLDSYIERFDYYFEICGCLNFAHEMAANPIYEKERLEQLILKFDKAQIIEAASFHGDIGQAKKGLDKMAAGEQQKVQSADQQIKDELMSLGEQYKDKFGVKFLISAKGKSAEFLLDKLKERINNTEEKELQLAREALLEITLKRVNSHPLDNLYAEIEKLRTELKIESAQLTLSDKLWTQSLAFGNCNTETWFEFASLSKTIGSCFAIEFLREHKISLDDSVAEVLKKYNSKFQLQSFGEQSWIKELKIKHLMSHAGLNMHYVNGIPSSQKMPFIEELLTNLKKYNYDEIGIINKPGEKFSYSGAGFMLLEYICELISKKPFKELTQNFIDQLGLDNFSFNQETIQGVDYANGFRDDGSMVDSGRLMFPAIAAGSMGTTHDFYSFLDSLDYSYNHEEGLYPICHDTAVHMLYGTDKGCRDFMASNMGLGVFVLEAGKNKFMLHQGANDGFRCIFLSCYQGPERGSGFILICNGDNQGMIFNAKVSQLILKHLNISGIDFSKFNTDFDYKNLKQEEIVNLGYKELVLNAFCADLPEEIIRTKNSRLLANYQMNLLRGAEIFNVSNQKFARVENLISDYEPEFDPALFGRQGKIMDSWESVRHNLRGYESAQFKLKKESSVNFVKICTKYHLGNQVEYIEILSKEGESILSKTKLEGHSVLKIKSESSKPTDEIMIKTYPDGGLTRVGLYSDIPNREEFDGILRKYDDPIPQTIKPMGLKFISNDGVVLFSASDEHYAPAKSILSPYPPINMFDGFESARSREADHFEQIVLAFDEPKSLSGLMIDFTYFVNNNPMFMAFEGVDEEGKTIPLIEKTFVKPYAGNKKCFCISQDKKLTQLKILIYPDGGFNRIKIYTRN